MPDETYQGFALPDAVVTGSAWRHRQAVKRGKGRQVARAVREGRDAFARDTKDFVPGVGDALFIKGIYDNAKERNYGTAAAMLAMAALPGFVSRAARPLLGKAARMTGRSVARSVGLPAVTRHYAYGGDGTHMKRVMGGSYRKVGLSSYPEELGDILSSPVNLEDPAGVELIADKAKVMPWQGGWFRRWLEGRLDSGRSTMFASEIDGNRLVYYRGSAVPGQHYFDTLLPHEAHHMLSFMGKGAGTLKRTPPPLDYDGFRASMRASGTADGRTEAFIRYIADPGNQWDESAARGTQVLDYFKVRDPRQKITGEMLEHAKRNYVKDTGVDNNMGRWFDLIGDRYDEMAGWINKYSTAVLPLVVPLGTAAVLKSGK